MSSKRWLLVASLLASLAATLTACGRKGDPLPPFRIIPAASQDLELRQQGEDFVLELGYPKLSVGGTALPGIDAVEVLRMSRPAPAEGFELPEVTAPEFEANAERVVELRGALLADSTIGDRIYLRRPLTGSEAQGQQAFTFGVRTKIPGGVTSALSNLVSLVPGTPPEPPRGLTLIPSPDGIDIGWTVPEGEVAGFNVYRRDARSRTYRQPLTTVDSDVTQYQDRSARFGSRYIYTVTTVLQREPLIESRLSGEAEVFYQDRFPPEPPGGLVALAETDRIRLRWDASPTRDVVGYHVYRQGASDFQRLTRRPIEERELVDDRVRTDRAYVYRVTAVDSLGNESAPSAEVSTTVR